MSRFSETTLLEIRERLPLTDFVQKRLGALKKAGMHYWACCPFHSEKSPSFAIKDTQNTFHCFGCQAHGDLYAFAMRYHQLTFPEAVRLCAEEAGVELEQSEDADADKGPAFQIMAKIAEYYCRQLNSMSAEIIRQYLRERGIDLNTQERFRIGYALPAWEGLVQAQLAHPTMLERLGMVVQKQGRCYDRFRDRIMFPIRQAQGKVVAFGGRAMGDQQGAKYLNSPETRLFHKQEVLYGWYEALQTGTPKTSAIIVEGYFDVMAFQQAGFHHTFAPMGTTLSLSHWSTLIRSYQRVYLCFDGDVAGEKATDATVERIWPYLTDDVSVFIMRPPSGQDPDEWVRSTSAETVQKAIAAATPLSTYMLEKWMKAYSLSTIEGKAAFGSTVKQELARCTHAPVFSGLMRQEAARLIGLETKKRVIQPVRKVGQVQRPQIYHWLAADCMRNLASVHQHEETWQMLFERAESTEMKALIAFRTWRQQEVNHWISEMICVEQVRTNWPILWHPYPLTLTGTAFDSEVKGAWVQIERILRKQRIDALLNIAKERDLSVQEQKMLVDLLKYLEKA